VQTWTEKVGPVHIQMYTGGVWSADLVIVNWRYSTNKIYKMYTGGAYGTRSRSGSNSN